MSSPDISKQVYKKFEIINSWIKYLKHKRMVLPSNFDYDFLFEGVLRCLASEQALICQIGLSFVTVNFSFFTAHHRLAFFRRLVKSGTYCTMAMKQTFQNSVFVLRRWRVSYGMMFR